MAYPFPRLKATLKDIPFLVFAAVLARLLKDLLVIPLGLYYNYLRDPYDPVKLAINWGLLVVFFFAILYVRHRLRKRWEG